MSEHNAPLERYIRNLGENIAAEYAISPEAYNDQSVKRGLRNADGTGVVIGVSHIGSVQGYYVEDGARVPMPGKLYYPPPSCRGRRRRGLCAGE